MEPEVPELLELDEELELLDELDPDELLEEPELELLLPEELEALEETDELLDAEVLSVPMLLPELVLPVVLEVLADDVVEAEVEIEVAVEIDAPLEAVEEVEAAVDAVLDEVEEAVEAAVELDPVVAPDDVPAVLVAVDTVALLDECDPEDPFAVLAVEAEAEVAPADEAAEVLLEPLPLEPQPIALKHSADITTAQGAFTFVMCASLRKIEPGS